MCVYVCIIDGLCIHMHIHSCDIYVSVYLYVYVYCIHIYMLHICLYIFMISEIMAFLLLLFIKGADFQFGIIKRFGDGLWGLVVAVKHCECTYG